MTRRTPPGPAGPPAGALWTAEALALIGLALAVVLARLHQQAHAGIASFCAVNETFNCDRVATSRYSVVLGIPVAVWGALGYGLAAALAAWALGRRGKSSWPRGVLFLVAAAAVAASVALAFVSKHLIGAFCILCAASWATSAGLFAAAWAACRPGGPSQAVRQDLAAVRANPVRAAAVVSAAVAGLVLAAATYPRYWERSRAMPAAGGARVLPAGVPPLVVEYSDYECPFCARAHLDAKAALAGRPDVKVVRRHFPLDPACNPAVKRAVHPGACELARAGVCAEAQGRFAEMDDLLFANQEARRPLEELARDAGLDLARFQECMGSAAAARRVADDAAAGVRDKIPATPAYVVGGTVSVGRIPWELLPPPPAAR